MHETGNNAAAKTAPSTLSDRVRSLRLQDTQEPASSWWSWLPWGVCVVLVVAAGLLALEAFTPIDDETLKKWAQERNLTLASDGSPSPLALPGTSSVTPASEIALESKGYIVAFSLIQVSPKISGTVLKLNIEEGREVAKDFVLAELEDVEYKSELDHAIAAKKSAQGRLDELRKYRDDEIRQMKADLDDTAALRDQALLKFNRAGELKKRGAIAIEDYEAADSGYRSLQSRTSRLQLAYTLMRKGPRDEKIAAASADIAQAQADYDKAIWRWNNTKVKAPIKGIILSKKTEEGNIVNPSAFSNGLSASLCEMADLLELEVDLSIAERDLAKTFKNQACRIRPEAYPNRIYPGYVSRIMPTADRSKGAVPVRVKVQFPATDDKGNALPKDRQGEYLRPDMGAIVTFLNRKKD